MHAWRPRPSHHPRRGATPPRATPHTGLFTLYIAYDTQKMIDEYEMGEDDHLKHAADLFIDFKIVFTRVLALLMGRMDD